jgi:hypothetical protein
MYRIAPGFIHRKIANADILVSVDVAVFNGYIVLNETCAFLLDAMKEPQTAEQLAQKLTEQYDVSHAQALEDVKEILHTFMTSGVVQEVTE